MVVFRFVDFFKKRRVNILLIALLLLTSLPMCHGQYKLKDSTKFINDQLPRYLGRMGKIKSRNYPVGGRDAILRILLKDYYVDRLVSGEDSLDRERYYALWNPLSVKTFKSLNTRDMFSYCMLVPEFDMQNCGSLGRLKGQYIFGVFYRMDMPLEYWSKRQLIALHVNRDSVVQYVEQMWPTLDFIGENTKDLVVELMMWELIPKVLDKLVLTPADNDLYSLLVQIMMRLKFKPFENSAIYEQLYGPASYIGSRIESNVENRNDIMKLARECFETLKALPGFRVPTYIKRERFLDPPSSRDLSDQTSTSKGPDWKWKKVDVPRYKLKL
jgi:hypothetical protein